MVNCEDVNKTVKDEAGGRENFVLLALLTQLHLECLKQIEKSGRDKFPPDQEKILYKKIKAQVKNLKPDLIHFDNENLRFIGIGLNDYTIGGNVDFNMFLVKTLLSSYLSISEEIPKRQTKDMNLTIKLNTLKRSIKALKEDKKINLPLNLNNNPEINRYLNTRRDCDSLYKIYSIIKLSKDIFEEKGVKIEVKALALQRVFHIAGEYLKYTQVSPNLSPIIRQSLEELGIPVKRLSKFRDMLAHNQVFPLIMRNNNEVKRLFGDFLIFQNVIKSKIIEIEDSFIQRVIEESNIGDTAIAELKQFKQDNGVQGLEQGIAEIKTDPKYLPMRKDMDMGKRRTVFKIHENVRRMRSMDFSESWAKISKDDLSKTYLNLITNHISQSKLKLYNQLRDEVAPKLKQDRGKLNTAHDDVLKVTQVIDRLTYKDTSSPNNSILDKFLSHPILEKIKVNNSSLKKELEVYFDAKSFKNNDAYVDFKDSNPKNLINLLKNNIFKPNDNKNKLITFFQSNIKTQDNYISPEEYERLVAELPISYKNKEKLFSYSVEWRKKKCVDLLEKKFSALKTLYDNIMEGNSIDMSVYTELADQYELPNESENVLKERAKSLNQHIKDVYLKKVIKEFDVLDISKNIYAVESQIINMYSLLEKAENSMNLFDIRILRNFLSHGDPLFSDEDYETIAKVLVTLKDAVVAQLRHRPINSMTIRSVLDKMQDYLGLTSIKELLCIFRNRRRNTRSASKSCLTLEEIHKFTKRGAENIDPDNIIIDSEKFIYSISGELEANDEKFSNFIALASKSEVIGDHTSKVNMLTDNHRYLNHLERVGKISNMVMGGMIAKDLVGDLLRGDYVDFGKNVAFLAVGSALQTVAKVASKKEAAYILKGKVFLAKTLRLAAPFLSRGVSAFIAYDMYRLLKNYKKGDIDALVAIVGDGIQLGLDSFEIIIETGEGLGLLAEVSVVTGPIAMGLGALSFIGTEVFTAARTVYKIDKSLPLTFKEEVFEGIRAFVGLEPSQDIKLLIKEKDLNNQVVKNATCFLKNNTHFQRYVFPSMEVYTKDESNPDFEVRKRLDNVVLLDEKKNDIKWSRTRPDNLEGIDFFCLPKGDWESVPEGGTYYCDGAIGIEYTNNRTGNDTWISLGDGKDVIKGFQGSSNTFVFGAGHKDITGGNKDDNFMFGGRSDDAVSDSKIEGSIDGRGGINTIDVGELTPYYKWSQGVSRYQVSADFRKGILKDTSKVALNIHNINVFLGRKGGVDQVVSACDTKHVNGRGGENKKYLDSVIIPKDDACYYDTKVAVNPYTKVTNNATSGNFVYIVYGEKGREAYTELGPSSQTNNTFVFNYTLTDVAAIDKSEKNTTFSFIEDFYKREKKIDVNSSFNLTVSGADKNITTYHLIDSTKIVLDQNRVSAIQNTTTPIDSLVKDYSSIADKSQLYVIVYSNNEVLIVGHNHGNVLTNEPTARVSHLVGGSGENVFVITSGQENLTLAKLPISDVVIYDFDQGNKINTLILREIKEQLKKDIDREISTEVSEIDNDLLINLSLDDASKKEVVKITLKGALKNNRYKRIHIDIDNIFVIEQILDDFELTPQPLIFHDNSTNIYVINPTDVAKGSKIIVKKKIGDYIFARNNDALFITNSLNSSADKNNLSTIILNDFYYGNNQDKMKSLIIEFNDKRIFLRENMASINMLVGNYSELKREVSIASYKAIMYTINEQKLFEAIEGNNIGEVKELIQHGVSIDARNNDGQTPLHIATLNGKLGVIKYLVEEKHADVNVKDNSGIKPLHYAASGSSLNIVKYLVEEKHADVNVKDNSGIKPLHYAAFGGNLEVVKYLAEEKHADFNVKDNSGIEPLHYAAFGGNLEVVKYLVEENHADVNVKDNYGIKPLHYAALGGNLEVVKYLLEEKHADVNIKENSGITSLHYAASSGGLNVVKYLIEEKHANVNVKDNSGIEPLHLAASDGRLEVVKYLVEEQHVNIKVWDNSGLTALHYAASGSSPDVVKCIIQKKGANVNIRGNFCLTLSHYAAFDGNLEVAKYLIEEKGAGIDVRDYSKKVPLHLAASNGNLALVRYLIEEKSADVDAKDSSGQVPLHLAASNGKLGVVKYLVEKKHADVNVKDDFDFTPLYLAVYDNLEVVKYLVGIGADVNLKDKSGVTPLHNAAHDGNLEMVKYLIEKGAKIDLKINGKTPLNMLESKGYKQVIHSIVKKLTERLFEAVKYDEVGEVQRLINQGVSVNVKDSGGQPLLHFAASNGKLKVVKYLIEKKQVDFNAKGDFGRTCLHLAARSGTIGVVKYLIEKKQVDFNVEDDGKSTPLLYAAGRGNLEVVKYLVEEKGANINVTNKYGITPLHNAAGSGSLEMVKYIIEEKNVNVNVKTNDGQAPLHFAARTGKLGVVKYLVEEKNVNVNITDNDGNTPLHVVAMNGSLEIARYLIEEKNADVNVKGIAGDTPLHSAAKKGRLEMVKYLTEKKGVDVNAKNDYGYTPLDFAAARGYSNIVKHLEMKLNGKREKPRQYKRSHRHLSRLLLTTDSSNQPKTATSNASEKSSWINDLVGSIVKLEESTAPSEAASSNHPIRHERRKRHNDHSRHEDSMRMHRVRHRHRRVQKRNVKYQDSHYYIDQPEIATSSGTRPTSWINGLVDWIKEKGGGLVSSVADKFAAKESEDSKSRGIHACSVRLEKMYSGTIPNIPQSRKSQGVPKGNIPNTNWSGWSSSREKVTSNVTDAPEMNITVLNNALILGDLAVRLANGTRHKQPIHENLLSLREKSLRFIDENMIMRTIQQGKEKFGGLDTNMDV